MIALICLLALILLAGCDPDDSDDDKNGPTLTPSPVPWQRAQEPITLANVPSIALLGRLDEHQTAVINLKFSDDGAYLATTSPGDSQVKVWNLASGRTVLSLPDIKARWLFFGPDNEAFITIDQERQIREWALFEQQQLRNFTAQNGLIGPADQSADLLRIAIGGEFGRIYLFSLNPLREEGFIDAHPTIPVQHVLFTPDGERVVSIGDGGSVKVWDFASRDIVHDFGRFEQEPNQVAISPDGSLLAASTIDSIQLWSLDNYALQRVMPIPENAAVGYLGFSSDGRMLLSYGVGDTVSIWNIDTGQVLVGLPGHGTDAAGAAFSTDLQMLISGARDAGIFLWDLSSLGQATDETGQVQIRSSRISPQGVQIYRLAWSPDQSRIVFSDLYGRVYVMGIPG